MKKCPPPSVGYARLRNPRQPFRGQRNGGPYQ
jgi:hypothetical protein